MQLAHKQILAEHVPLREEHEAHIAELLGHVDTLIADYVILKKLRPVFARDWLKSIHHALDLVRYHEQEMNRVIDPDVPF